MSLSQSFFNGIDDDSGSLSEHFSSNLISAPHALLCIYVDFFLAFKISGRPGLYVHRRRPTL